MKKIFYSILLLLSCNALYGQMQWNKIAGLPDGGNIIDIDVDSAGHIYALTSLHTNIYYSEDNGASWQQIPNTSDLWNANAIEVDKTTGALYVASFWFGVVHTSDMGAHWTEDHFHSIPGGFYADIERVGCKHGTGIVVAAENTGGGDANIFVSADAGSTWWMTGGVPWQQTLALYFSSNGTLFSGCNQGVYRSGDNGHTWSASNSGLASKIVFSIAERQSNGHLFAAVGFDIAFTDTINCGVYRSTDNGFTWVNITGSIANHDVRSVAYDAVNNKLYAASTSCIYESSDEGVSWTAVSAGIDQTDIWCVASGNEGMFAGTSRMGVKYSLHPATGWIDRNRGISVIAPTGLTLGYHNNNIHSIDGVGFTGGMAGATGVYNLTSAGWQHQYMGLPIPGFSGTWIVNDSNDVLYATYRKRNNGLYRSLDNGATWTNISAGIPGVAFSPVVLYTPFVGKDNSLYIIANNEDALSNKVFRSTDSGNTWTEFFAGDTMGFDVVTDIDFASNAIYLSHGGMQPYLSVTFDNGATFDTVAFDFGVPYGATFTVAANDSIYMEMAGHVYKRVGIGNWVQLPDGAWNPDFNSYPLTLYADRANNIYATSFQRGVFKCSNDSTWTDITTGLPTYSYIYEPAPVKLTPDLLAFDKNNVPYALCTHRYAGTLPGIYKYSLPSGVSSVQGTSPGILLYPNPATDKIAVRVPGIHVSGATLQVFDVSGKLMTEKQLTTDTFPIEVADYNPGVYFIRVVTSGTAIQSKFIKM